MTRLALDQLIVAFTTPFGLEFDARGDLLVSETFGGRANASALSSYEVDEESGALSIVSASVPTNQTAACWVVTARHGRFAYVTNTGSGLHLHAHPLQSRSAQSHGCVPT